MLGTLKTVELSTKARERRYHHLHSDRLALPSIDNHRGVPQNQGERILSGPSSGDLSVGVNLDGKIFLASLKPSLIATTNPPDLRDQHYGQKEKGERQET